MAKKRENPFSKSEDKVKVPRMEETEEDRESVSWFHPLLLYFNHFFV